MNKDIEKYMDRLVCLGINEKELKHLIKHVKKLKLSKQREIWGAFLPDGDRIAFQGDAIDNTIKGARK